MPRMQFQTEISKAGLERFAEPERWQYIFQEENTKLGTEAQFEIRFYCFPFLYHVQKCNLFLTMTATFPLSILPGLVP